MLPVKLGCPSASPSTGASEMPSVPVFDGFVFGADFVLRCVSVRPIKVGAEAFPPTGLRLLRSDSPDPSLANLDSISVLLISSTATVVCLSVRFWGTPWGGAVWAPVLDLCEGVEASSKRHWAGAAVLLLRCDGSVLWISQGWREGVVRLGSSTVDALFLRISCGLPLSVSFLV